MQSFKKEERLRSKKLIDRLFEEGNDFFESPFKVIWLDISHESNVPVQLLISVSKRKIRKAVSRNLLKRRIREAYRKNKSGYFDFLKSQNRHCLIGIIYTYGRIAKYEQIEQKIILVLQRLQKELLKENVGPRSGNV
ncbi:MAG: ribonuclease P protein component [Bacteroidales bacterium]